jgi:hypothetical protein
LAALAFAGAFASWASVTGPAAARAAPTITANIQFVFFMFMVSGFRGESG